MNEISQYINGLEFCISLTGDPQNPPIIILHGWLDHAGSWSVVADELAAHGYCVIIPDQRGHGKTAHAPLSTHYHFPDYVADLTQLIIQRSIENVILIGHSMGGTIASLYSALCTPTPQHLILIEGLGPPNETEDTAFKRYQQHLVQRNLPSTHTLLPSIEIAAAKLQRTHPYLSNEWSFRLAKRLLKPIHDGYQWRWDSRHRHKSAIAFHLPRHLEVLGSVNCPTDLIFGEQSWYLQLPDLQARIDSFSTPPAIHSLPSGHNPHLQCPEPLSQQLLRIISTYPTS